MSVTPDKLRTTVLKQRPEENWEKAVRHRMAFSLLRHLRRMPPIDDPLRGEIIDAAMAIPLLRFEGPEQ